MFSYFSDINITKLLLKETIKNIRFIFDLIIVVIGTNAFIRREK